MYRKNCISVIMPVYNVERYVAESIGSILNQSFRDFELIIIDDGSTDSTGSIIRSFHDNRIRIISNQTNKGNYRCRNLGLKLAKGKYVCVMDGDDIALQERLKTQYKFMEEHSKYAIVGSDIEFFSEIGTSVFSRLRNKERIKVFLLKDNCSTHPSIMIRRSFIEKSYIRYNEQYEYAADYNLMVKVSRHASITNIPEVLLKYRLHSDQISHRKRIAQIKYADKIRLKQLRYFKIDPTELYQTIHLKLMKGEYLDDEAKEVAMGWANELLQRNFKLKLYRQEYLYEFLQYVLINSLNAKSYIE
jgi:glycosyltransferase involved in cell wall biosynthesis